ncbi:heme-dependent oxidative N-demethylase family protein [Rhizobium sp. YTU87027]|uniref:heme-dependent oxidative N-demethylase family protein n=1 Tax=Rhizobium sp. YTU87027 TaxID=3417741 RepID=UPI003D682EE1
MTRLTYTPYGGSTRPFTIGLMPLDLARWIEPDSDRARYICEKRRLIETHRDEIFVAEGETAEAQQEVLDLLQAHLADDHPARARSISDAAEQDPPPLLRAGLLVQDDLVIMRRREDGWHLVAGFVAFPSSWSLQEKFGRPMQAIHADVPGFGEGTRNAALITRIFDSLQVSHPVERLNWSVNVTDDLFLPLSKHRRPPPAGPFTLAERFARVERQTLRKLPKSGDILFTIRVYVDPIAAIAHHPNASKLAVSFAAQLDGLDEHQAAYKGLTLQRAELAAKLRALADTLSPA